MGIIPMTASINRRKWINFLLYPSFQFRLALTQIIFGMLIVTVLFVALLLPTYKDRIFSDNVIMQYTANQLVLQVFDRAMLIALLIIIASAVFHIILSHRLCGPLINMRQSFKRLTDGDTTRKVLLRRKDFLKEEAHLINTMLAAIETRIINLRTNHESMAELVGQLPEGRLENRLRNLVEENQQLLNQWTVTPLPENTQHN
jgi:methyl-accepting chemotaxis protein